MTLIHTRPLQKARILVLITLLFLLISSFLLAWPCRSVDTFIGHADQANLANLAQNIVHGKGPVVDTAWIYTNGGLPGARLPQPEPYWSIYAAYLIAPFFKLFGETRLSLLIVPLLLRAVIVGICVATVYSFDKQKLTPPLVLAFILCFTPVLNDSVSGLSDIYMATAVLLSILLLAFGVARTSVLLLSVSGVFAGIAVGMKPSGVTAFFALPLLVYLVIKFFPRKKILRSIACYLLGGLFGVSFLFAYNFSNFSTFASPGYKVIAQSATVVRSLYRADMSGRLKDSSGKPLEIAGARMDKSDFVLFAQFNPEASPNSLPSGFVNRREWYKAPLHNVYGFVDAVSKGQLFPLWSFPYILLGAYILMTKFLHLNDIRRLTEAELLLLVSFSIFIGGLVLAFRVSFFPRYWLFCLPFIWMICFYGVRKSTYKPALYSLALFILSVPWAVDGYKSYARNACSPQSPAYRKVRALVPEDAILMTTNPWQFSFHTRRRSVVTPYTSDPRILRDLARRYKVGYLAVVKDDTSQEYSLFRKMLDRGDYAMFQSVFNDKYLALYKIIDVAVPASTSLNPLRSQ